MTLGLILVDSSIWIDYLNQGDPAFAALLDRDRIVVHPFVIGEIALGSLKNRTARLAEFEGLPAMEVVAARVVLDLIGSAKLWGTGIGYVDAHLLATAVAQRVKLWTRDKRLRAATERLGVAADVA